MNNRITRWFFIACVGFASQAAGDIKMQENYSEAQGNDIEVIIGGEPGTEFSGSLTVFQKKDAVTHQLAGTVPQNFHYLGTGIEINVKQLSSDGELEIQVRKAGNVSRSRTRGAQSELRLRVQ